MIRCPLHLQPHPTTHPTQGDAGLPLSAGPGASCCHPFSSSSQNSLSTLVTCSHFFICQLLPDLQTQLGITLPREPSLSPGLGGTSAVGGEDLRTAGNAPTPW